MISRNKTKEETQNIQYISPLHPNVMVNRPLKCVVHHKICRCHSAVCFRAVCKRKSDLCVRQLHIGTGSSDLMGRRLWLILGFKSDGLDCWKLIPGHPSCSAVLK